MPNFIVISSNAPLPISNEEWTQNGWKDSIKFNSDHRIVNKEGKTPRLGFTGQRYQIICKIERDFSYLERTKRGFLGALKIACSLGFSLFSKSARELFTKQKEKLRFATLMPSEGFDISEKELQQGISVSEETVSKIQTLVKNIFKEHQEGIRLYPSQERHLVFELDTAPGLLFKIDYYNSMKDRYQNMIYAQTVIRAHQLGLLVIPKAKLFSVIVEDKKYEVIAEQKMDINPYESAQEEYFLDYADSLNETIRQLALFICKTGYSDVTWGNNPILHNSFDGRNRKIALIDLEEINSPEIGLFGKENMQRGLLGCVNEEQGKMIETIAKENDISTSFFKDASSRRKKELEKGHKLKEYYEKKGIIKGNELIKIDESQLVFSADPETEKKLKELTLDLIQGINTVIAKDSSGEAIKERRSIYVNTNCERFQGISNTLVHPDKKTDKGAATFFEYAVKKLKDLGVIYGAELNDSDCYLQA